MSAWGKGGLAKSCNTLLKRVEDNDTQLKELVILPSKDFGTSEVSRLASAIGSGKNTNLTSISASGHAVDPASLSLIGNALARVYAESRKSTGIISIALGDRNMGDEGVAALCESLESSNGGYLLRVDFGWKKISQRGTSAIGKTFGANSSLQQLNISRNPDVGDDGLVDLCTFATEKMYKLKTQDNASPQSIFPELRHLDLSECNIGPDGVKKFSECFLPSNINDSTRANLLSLKLNDNPIGNQGMGSLARLISSSFTLSSSLISLSLEKCQIDDEGIRILTSNVVKNGCAGLRVLDFANNKIGEEGAKCLSRSFQYSSWSTLSELNLAGNPLGSKGIVEICNGCSAVTTLENLNLCDTSCGADGAMAAIRLSNLTSLRLFNNRLGSDGFYQIASILKGGHKTLVNLDLGGNSAKEEAVVTLLQALLIENENVENSALRVLEIGGNEMGAEGENVVKEIGKKIPELDVARDRPKSEPQP